MGSNRAQFGELIERWSPTLFLAGGALLVGHAAMLSVQAFTDLATPPDLFGPAGHLVALAGLLGLYPALARRTPAAARAAGVVAVVALAGWAVLTVGRLLAVAGLVPSLGEALPGVVAVLAFASTILAYALFGLATLRIDDGSRVVGLLVLAPAVLIGAALVDAAVTGASAVDGVVVGGGLALATLALGTVLRTWDRPTDHAAPAADVTTG